MKNTGKMLNLENIIQTVQLSNKEFDSLQYYIGCKEESRIVVTTEEALEDLNFSLSKKDKKLILELKPKVIQFVRK